ncbi:tetratricopeptide repeat protein [Kocuria palustris]|nr:tetratricopeptide repeat protein [Kocuria palustris]
MDNAKSFIAKNKTALTVTALALIAAVSAYYVYTQLNGAQPPAPAPEDDAAAKKKKKNKKKKLAKSASPEPATGAAADATTAKKERAYPVDAKGLPALTDDVIASLSDADKDAWALALKEDGNSEFKHKRYDEAIAYYTAALQLKQDPIFYLNRLACYAALEDHENVIKDTSAAIKLKPDYTKCVLRRANSYEILEKYEDSMFDLTALTIYGGFLNKLIEQVLERVLKKHSIKIVELAPKELQLPSAATIGSFFGAFVEETNPEGISAESEGGAKYMYEALQAINGNTVDGYDKADTLINQAVEAFKDVKAGDADAGIAAVALEYSAAFKFLKNDSAAAAVDIQSAIDLKPRPRSYVFRALINADKLSYKEALEDFKRAEDLDPKCLDIYYHLGQLYYLTGDLANAETQFTKARELNPKNVYAYIQLACITYKNGNIDLANEKFTEAKLKFATAPEVPNYYGEILADRGDIPAACNQFDIAARLQELLPVFSVGALPLINKATCLSRENLERIDEAEELLVKACELDPKSELARISLAQIKLQKDQVDEAIALFEELSRLARSFEEKVQATSFAEATKMQKRIKNDPVLTQKIAEVMRESGIQM